MGQTIVVAGSREKIETTNVTVQSLPNLLFTITSMAIAISEINPKKGGRKWAAYHAENLAIPPTRTMVRRTTKLRSIAEIGSQRRLPLRREGAGSDPVSC